jgi:hypothetical protein
MWNLGKPTFSNLRSLVYMQVNFDNAGPFMKQWLLKRYGTPTEVPSFATTEPVELKGPEFEFDNDDDDEVYCGV